MKRLSGSCLTRMTIRLQDGTTAANQYTHDSDYTGIFCLKVCPLGCTFTDVVEFVVDCLQLLYFLPSF